MDSLSRRYYYPMRNPDDPTDVTLVEITEEQYRTLYPEIWRTQKQQRAMGCCRCPRKMLWKCDADCLVCPYHTAGKIWSLEQDTEILGDHRADELADPSDIVGDQLLLQQLIQRLEELCPGAIAVGETKLSGASERGALEALDMSRMTYRNRLKKAEKILREEFGDIF